MGGSSYTDTSIAIKFLYYWKEKYPKDMVILHHPWTYEISTTCGSIKEIGNWYKLPTCKKQNAELKSGVCTREFAENYPATAIMDNDDFKDDTLTAANTSHRTSLFNQLIWKCQMTAETTWI